MRCVMFILGPSRKRLKPARRNTRVPSSTSFLRASTKGSLLILLSTTITCSTSTCSFSSLPCCRWRRPSPFPKSPLTPFGGPLATAVATRQVLASMATVAATPEPPRCRATAWTSISISRTPVIRPLLLPTLLTHVAHRLGWLQRSLLWRLRRHLREHPGSDSSCF
jgi:hypothetical protein